MEYLLTSSQMKQLDEQAIKKAGIPSMVLMERAALEIRNKILPLLSTTSRVYIFCGNGNNGGDGFCLGRLLHQKGIDTKIIFLGNLEKLTLEAKSQKDILKYYNYEVTTDIPSKTKSTDILIDCLFGVGLNRTLTSDFVKYIHQINSLDGIKIAVDIPSGISSDDGNLMGTAFRADYTFTLAFYKRGLGLYPGISYCGEISLLDIGIPWDNNLQIEKKDMAFFYTDKDLDLLPKRPSRSNKGTFGKVYFLMGSKNMAGAAYLAGMAAYAAGCGLVEIITPEENRIPLQTLLPEAILTTYHSLPAYLEDFTAKMKEAQIVGVGSGLGNNPDLIPFIDCLLSMDHLKLLIDADALNLISSNESLKKKLAQRQGPYVITPHLKEMSRLINIDTQFIKDNMQRISIKWKELYKGCCILKDARTIVTQTKKPIYINQTGNSGMAAAGSGDILAGLICGLLAQGMDIWEASTVGVFLHGRSGDFARDSKNEYSLMARDILEHISKAIIKT